MTTPPCWPACGGSSTPSPTSTVAAARPAAAELARELDGLRPDVLILDYDLARDDGLAHCRRIKSRPNPPAVIIYSAYAGPALTLAARAAHADGVIDKADPGAQPARRDPRRVANGRKSYRRSPATPSNRPSHGSTTTTSLYSPCCSTASRSTRSRTRCAPNAPRSLAAPSASSAASVPGSATAPMPH